METMQNTQWLWPRGDFFNNVILLSGTQKVLETQGEISIETNIKHNYRSRKKIIDAETDFSSSIRVQFRLIVWLRWEGGSVQDSWFKFPFYFL